MINCFFYKILVSKDYKIQKEIIKHWEEQIKISVEIRNTYDREMENKFKQNHQRNDTKYIKNNSSF